jgi:exosortase
VLISASWSRRGWTDARIAAALVLVSAAVAITFDAWRDIFRIATRDEESTHIFLVPIVAAWLFAARRRRLRHFRPSESFLGPLVVLVGWLMHSIGDTYLIQSFYHAGAVVMAAGCLVTVFGTSLLTEFFPVFLTLAFLVPVPARVRQQIAIPLQTLTAHLTAELFHLIGAPVIRTGNTLSVNGMEIQIAEACNGLRMMFALALAMFAFAFGRPLRTYARVLVLLATPFSAVACNVVRLVPTVWLYGYHPATVAARFHDIGGWVMLGVSFLILLAIVRLLRWALVPVTAYTLAYD